jgi:hypothetical protein
VKRRSRSMKRRSRETPVQLPSRSSNKRATFGDDLPRGAAPCTCGYGGALRRTRGAGYISRPGGKIASAMGRTQTLAAARCKSDPPGAKARQGGRHGRGQLRRIQEPTARNMVFLRADCVQRWETDVR